jgi:Spy/CpxP family protein refolding chaperone
MNMRAKIMFLAGLVAVFMWSGYTLAATQDSNDGPPPMGPGGPPMGPGPGGAGGIIGVIMQRLDLTDDQHDKIETILDTSRDKVEKAQKAVGTARKALDDAVAGDANEAAIRSAATALGAAIGDEAVLRAATMKEIKAVLTAEQLKTLEEIQARMKARVGRPPQDGPRGQRPRPMGPPPAELQEE